MKRLKGLCLIVGVAVFVSSISIGAPLFNYFLTPKAGFGFCFAAVPQAHAGFCSTAHPAIAGDCSKVEVPIKDKDGNLIQISLSGYFNSLVASGVKLGVAAF
jgi:hypothetical protein